MGHKNSYDVHFRVRRATDPLLYAWLQDIEARALPHGGKAIEIKSILRAGLQALGYVEGAAPSQPMVDSDALGMQLGRSLTEFLAPEILAPLRQIVEAAVLSAVPRALRGLSLSGVPDAVDDVPLESEADAAFYAALETHLFLRED